MKIVVFKVLFLFLVLFSLSLKTFAAGPEPDPKFNDCMRALFNLTKGKSETPPRRDPESVRQFLAKIREARSKRLAAISAAELLSRIDDRPLIESSQFRGLAPRPDAPSRMLREQILAKWNEIAAPSVRELLLRPRSPHAHESLLRMLEQSGLGLVSDDLLVEVASGMNSPETPQFRITTQVIDFLVRKLIQEGQFVLSPRPPHDLYLLTPSLFLGVDLKRRKVNSLELGMTMDREVLVKFLEGQRRLPE